MKTKIYLFLAVILLGVSSVSAQLSLPRESQRQTISQIIGDTNVSVVYHRPSVKSREIWGKLVPYGEVWRTGANEATIFEISRDVKVNGQTLAAGKYSLHTIPNREEWTIIFNRTTEQWGSFNYDAKQDILRFNVKPAKAEFQETMVLGFDNVRMNTADFVIAWENVKVPFTIDVGDVAGRTLTDIRARMTNLKPEDAGTAQTAANWVLSMKLAASYNDALGWVNAGLKARETYPLMVTKARLLAELNRKPEAIATAEKAVQLGKSSTPAVNTANLEKMISDWKQQP